MPNRRSTTSRKSPYRRPLGEIAFKALTALKACCDAAGQPRTKTPKEARRKPKKGRAAPPDGISLPTNLQRRLTDAVNLGHNLRPETAVKIASNALRQIRSRWNTKDDVQLRIRSAWAQFVEDIRSLGKTLPDDPTDSKADALPALLFQIVSNKDPGDILRKHGRERALHDQFQPAWTIEGQHDDFCGRDVLLDSVAGEFEARSRRILILHGQPGVGKSQVALALAHRLKPLFPDGGHKIDLRGADKQRRVPMSRHEALATLIRGLLTNPNVPLPDSEDKLLGIYHGILTHKRRRVLMVLDNAKDAEHVEALLPPAPCAVIITSRREFALHGVRPQKLPPFDKTVAVERLRFLAPQLSNTLVQVPPQRGRGKVKVRDAAEYAAELLGCLPLAVVVFARAVRRHSALHPVPELIERMRTGRLDDLREIDGAVDLSWELLPVHLKLCFEQLSVFPGEFHWTSAAAVWGNPPETTERDFLILVEENLVEMASVAHRFRLHDQLWDYAQRKLANRGEGAQKQAMERFASHYMALLKSAEADYLEGNAKQTEALGFFVRERINIDACLEWAEMNHETSAAAANICSALWKDSKQVLSHCLSHRERIGLADASLAAARKTGDVLAQVRALHQRGICLALDGKSNEAESAYDEASCLLDSGAHVETEALVLRAIVAASKAWYFIDVADYGEAIPVLQQSVEVLKKCGGIYDELYAVEGLGEAIMQNNQPRQAREWFNYIRTRLDNKYGKQREQTVYDTLALRCLGWSYALEGQPQTGIKPCWQAVKLARDVLKHPRVESIARSRLAFCLWKAGKIKAAIVEYLEAFNLATQWSLGGRVEILEDLWNIAIETGRTDMALWTAEAFLQCKPNKRFAGTNERIQRWLANRRHL